MTSQRAALPARRRCVGPASQRWRLLHPCRCHASAATGGALRARWRNLLRCNRSGSNSLPPRRWRLRTLTRPTRGLPSPSSCSPHACWVRPLTSSSSTALRRHSPTSTAASVSPCSRPRQTRRTVRGWHTAARPAPRAAVACHRLTLGTPCTFVRSCESCRTAGAACAHAGCSSCRGSPKHSGRASGKGGAAAVARLSGGPRGAVMSAHVAAARRSAKQGRHTPSCGHLA